MKVLISGGAGYIGSTIASALLDGGHTPILLDSLVTGRREFTKIAFSMRLTLPIGQWCARFSANTRTLRQLSIALP